MSSTQPAWRWPPASSTSTATPTGTLPVDGTAQSKVRQGVTLDVGGERASVAPLAGEVLEERRSNARSQGYELDWTDLSGYFEHVMRKGISLNVAIKIAPQQVKRVVVGGSVEQAATPEQLERMKQLIIESMHDGAIGIASWFRGGGYRFAEEMIPMAQAAVDHGAVVYETHVGSEGYQLEEELQKAIDIVEQTGLPVSVAHFKIRRSGHLGSAGACYPYDRGRARARPRHHRQPVPLHGDGRRGGPTSSPPGRVRRRTSRTFSGAPPIATGSATILSGSSTSRNTAVSRASSSAVFETTAPSSSTTA